MTELQTPNETPRPLITESSTAESLNVGSIMDEMNDGLVVVPDYQRDSDQWDAETKSLLIESVINNLTIPAFFLESRTEDGVSKRHVVDGQQRLTTLSEFYRDTFRLVKSEEAAYLTPNSVHYAGKTFAELPQTYQQSFKRYRLSVITLRDLGHMRLEIFRRINRGGEPLSGQDIRLAYYGDGSPSLAFVRLVGIYDRSRPGPSRHIASARELHGLEFPWPADELDTWRDWWQDKQIARGQTASEMFLWSIAGEHVDQLDNLLQNRDALAKIRVSYNRTLASALDALAAQLAYQDKNPDSPPLLATAEALKFEFFPFFREWFHLLLARKGPSLPVTKNRVIALVIGTARWLRLDQKKLSETNWTDIVEFIRRPREMAKLMDVEWPASKGRWDGTKGYGAQIRATREYIRRVTA